MHPDFVELRYGEECIPPPPRWNGAKFNVVDGFHFTVNRGTVRILLKPDGFDAILPPVILKAKKPLSPSHLYPKELNTLGDHIRKRRLDLGLMQKEVAKIIGVTQCVIKCWEWNKNQPHFRYFPKIAEFLGYCPYKRLDSFGERLQRVRHFLGMSRAEFGQLVRINPSKLGRWEKETESPEDKLRCEGEINRAIASVFNSFVPK